MKVSLMTALAVVSLTKAAPVRISVITSHEVPQAGSRDAQLLPRTAPKDVIKLFGTTIEVARPSDTALPNAADMTRLTLGQAGHSLPAAHPRGVDRSADQVRLTGSKRGPVAPPTGQPSTQRFAIGGSNTPASYAYVQAHQEAASTLSAVPPKFPFLLPGRESELAAPQSSRLRRFNTEVNSNAHPVQQQPDLVTVTTAKYVDPFEADPDWKLVHSMASNPNAYKEWHYLYNALRRLQYSSKQKSAGILRAEISIIAQREAAIKRVEGTPGPHFPNGISIQRPDDVTAQDWITAQGNVTLRRNRATDSPKVA